MSLSKKAIFAALVLSLTPAIASAQSISFQPGPGAIINGIDIPNEVRGGSDVRPGAPAPITPVFGMDCGAQHFQYYVGLNLGLFPAPPQTYIARPGTARTMQYIPDQLNFDTDGNGNVTRVYCG